VVDLDFVADVPDLSLHFVAGITSGCERITKKSRVAQKVV